METEKWPKAADSPLIGIVITLEMANGTRCMGGTLN